MATPAHKNPVNLLRAFREKALSRTNVTNFARASKIRALADAFSEELISLREEGIRADLDQNISTAKKQALVDIGTKLGLPPITAKHAQVFEEEFCLAFYVASGTFGDINSGVSISLPSTVIVSSESSSTERNTSVEYIIQSTVLPSTSSTKYVTARAINIGSASNVGPMVLRKHNFTNYTDSGNETLKVVNLYPILSGTDQEADDNYRVRLANCYNRLITNNETRLKLTALDMPGVVNTSIHPGYYGIGTAAVFALAAENQVSSQLLTGLQERLDAWRAPGADFLATGAIEVHFDLEMQFKPTKPMTVAQTARLKTEVNRAVLSYLNAVPLGGAVDLEDMLSAIQRKITTAGSFPQANINNVFKRVFIRKGVANGPTDEQYRLIANSYSLGLDEFASLGTLNVEVL